MTDAYDNRGFRRAHHCQELAAAVRGCTLSPAGLQEYLKQHVFPTLYRASHILLYNELLHGGAGGGSGGGAGQLSPAEIAAALEDPSTLEAEQFPFEAVMADAIRRVLAKSLPPIEGLKRKELAEGRFPEGWAFTIPRAGHGW